MTDLIQEDLLRIRVINSFIDIANRSHEEPELFNLTKKALQIITKKNEDPDMYHRFKCVIYNGVDPAKN